MNVRVAPRQAGDIAVAAAIVLFAVLALQLRDSMLGLGEMADGIRETGVAIEQSGRETGAELRRSFDVAAGSIGSLPIVGPDAAQALREAADSTAQSLEEETSASGQELIQAGRDGESSARASARAFGWLVFLVPTTLLLAQWLPNRLRVRAA
jgi:hypothetical protein